MKEASRHVEEGIRPGLVAAAGNRRLWRGSPETGIQAASGEPYRRLLARPGFSQRHATAVDRTVEVTETLSLDLTA